MKREEHEKVAAQLAKAMAMICVRNTMLEGLHAGRVPVTKTGDFSDVFVVNADGQHIPWTEVSRLDDDEMRDLMRQVVNRLYTFQVRFDELEFRPSSIVVWERRENGTNQFWTLASRRAHLGPDEC